VTGTEANAPVRGAGGTAADGGAGKVEAKTGDGGAGGMAATEGNTGPAAGGRGVRVTDSLVERAELGWQIRMGVGAGNAAKGQVKRGGRTGNTSVFSAGARHHAATKPAAARSGTGSPCGTGQLVLHGGAQRRIEGRSGAAMNYALPRRDRPSRYGKWARFLAINIQHDKLPTFLLSYSQAEMSEWGDSPQDRNAVRPQPRIVLPDRTRPKSPAPYSKCLPGAIVFIPCGAGVAAIPIHTYIQKFHRD
jgi:hypothetical protein